MAARILRTRGDWRRAVAGGRPPRERLRKQPLAFQCPHLCGPQHQWSAIVLARLRRASDALNRVVIGVCIACLLVMLGISFTGFLYQLFTGAALAWTYSLARLFVPWIGMLSITVAFKTGEHVAMSVLLRFFPQPVVNVILWVNVALIGVFALLLVWFGWSFFINSTHYNMVSDQIQVHQRFVAACVPLTGVILLVHLVCGRALLDFADPEAEAEALVREAGAAPGDTVPGQ